MKVGIFITHQPFLGTALVSALDKQHLTAGLLPVLSRKPGLDRPKSPAMAAALWPQRPPRAVRTRRTVR